MEYLNTLPGFTKAKIRKGVNAYSAICYICKTRVEPGVGIRNTVKGPFSMIHKVAHKGCVDKGE